jgi:sec-independent protein translocase protein TatB
VARAFGEMLGKAQRYVSQVRTDIQREIELADLKRLQEEAQKATASIDSSVKEVTGSLQDAAQQASSEISALSTTGAPPPHSVPVWSAGGWGSHRFRLRSHPGPSLNDLTEAVEQLRGRMAMPAAGRFGKNRYAPRSRVNRPRIYR